MSAATTIIFARDDLSIPGAVDDAASISQPAGSIEAQFFDLVSRTKPDVIVLDFSDMPPAGNETILTIRRRTDIPILVVCNPEHPLINEYRIAGAADCISTPVDIVCLNQAIQKIMRVRGRGGPASSRAPEDLLFAEMSFRPGRNLLAGEDSRTVDLTSSEGRLLAHFLSKPWTLCTRNEIGELLYGPDHTVGDRAIDVIVNRLRKKLVSAGGADAEQLIKTDFKRGYLLVADVVTLPRDSSTRPRTVLERVG
jgi:DNA-binding response OmpR family regulator